MCLDLLSIVPEEGDEVPHLRGGDGIELIAAAMERFQNVASLQTYACGAFGNLAGNHSNQSAIAASGGLELVTIVICGIFSLA